MPGTANANRFGPVEGCCPWADNSVHNYYMMGLTAASTNAMNYAMMTRLQSTDMTADKFESWNNDTDIVVQDDIYASGFWGQTRCIVYVANTNYQKCNRFEMLFNLSPTPTAGLACHEVGHSVGLDHSVASGSCMVDPPVSNNFDSHDRDVHINVRY